MKANMKVAEIVKTTNIIKVTADDKLSSSLAKLASSHDATFVFDGKKFLGVINPYHCLIVNSYPGVTKSGRAVVMPPKLKLTDDVSRAVGLMAESKIHYLPVFNDRHEFQGIVTARRILRKVQKMAIFDMTVGRFIASKRPLIVVNLDESLAQALNKFKKSKVSKLVVVDGREKLRGILAYYDLVAYLSAPKKKEGQGDRGGKKLSALRYKVRNFMKRRVLTVYGDDRLATVIQMILDQKIGSIVLVNRENRPLGIITTRDILELLFRQKRRINFKILTRNLSEGNKKIVNFFVKSFLRRAMKMARIKGVKETRLMVKEEKRGGLFKVFLGEIFRRGKPRVIKEEGKNLPRVLKKVEKKAKVRRKPKG